MPPELRGSACPAGERLLPRQLRCSRARRLPPLQALPPERTQPQDRQAALVRTACHTIDTAEDAPALADLARAAGLSPYHFHRVFKAVTGVTPKAYALARRAARVQDGLGRAATVTEAIYDAGFNASSRFYEGAAGRLGMTPGAYRAGGLGTAIRFAVGECSLGAVLVAATDRGVCAIAFGDDPAPLLQDLQDRFPNAELLGADPAFEAIVAQVVAAVETPGKALDLPLDIRGTAFQQRVWQALRAIPPGRTATYAQIAATLGIPAAVRAVAGACAANTLALAIPCHRVIRTDGTLSGYRLGRRTQSHAPDPRAASHPTGSTKDAKLIVFPSARNSRSNWPGSARHGLPDPA